MPRCREMPFIGEFLVCHGFTSVSRWCPPGASAIQASACRCGLGGIRQRYTEGTNKTCVWAHYCRLSDGMVATPPQSQDFLMLRWVSLCHGRSFPQFLSFADDLAGGLQVLIGRHSMAPPPGRGMPSSGFVYYFLATCLDAQSSPSPPIEPRSFQMCLIVTITTSTKQNISK